MKTMVRALACSALIASLSACVVNQPPPPRQVVVPAPAPVLRPNPREVALERFGQVNSRIDNLGRRIDWHVNGGYSHLPRATHCTIVLTSYARKRAIWPHSTAAACPMKSSACSITNWTGRRAQSANDAIAYA